MIDDDLDPEEQPILTDIDNAYFILTLLRSEIEQAIPEIPIDYTAPHIEEFKQHLANLETIDKCRYLITSLLDPRGFQDAESRKPSHQPRLSSHLGDDRHGLDSEEVL